MRSRFRQFLDADDFEWPSQIRRQQEDAMDTLPGISPLVAGAYHNTTGCEAAISMASQPALRYRLPSAGAVLLRLGL